MGGNAVAGLAVTYHIEAFHSDIAGVIDVDAFTGGGFGAGDIDVVTGGLDGERVAGGAACIDTEAVVATIKDLHSVTGAGAVYSRLDAGELLVGPRCVINTQYRGQGAAQRALTTTITTTIAAGNNNIE